ncbi:uncharacterized protein LOC102677885 isoform X2 [Apis dorsata]|uniref:uncharacterized protein LOC102677885 isoform X2 n=1 Tax=Apis dorsata TaxID=7462 RepID=UPI00129382F2|nr:uncharacterized protein LOC102677885 isoform X2 [Apis dorsata]
MGGASDTLAWSCLVLPFSKRTDTIKWGKSNKQHRATSQRSRAGIRANRTVSTRGCWKWAVLIRGGALCRWTAPQDAIVCWRRSIVRRARRMPTPDVATPLSHATPSRPSSSFCLFSLPSASCLNFSSESSNNLGVCFRGLFTKNEVFIDTLLLTNVCIVDE